METKTKNNTELHTLAAQLEGELHFDGLMRTLYSTDASVYQELPLAVAFPKNTADIVKLVKFADATNTPLIPRAAGTSLAGQCVGTGLVVDVSKHLTEILAFNAEEQWIHVQPGIVRDDLNRFLAPHGLFFSPITSTANRATIGGMVGNNSSGTTSIQYGTTREHVLELDTVLYDGSTVKFAPLSSAEFAEKTKLNTAEGIIYKTLETKLANAPFRAAIKKQFPKASIHRRNTGYALDYLSQSAVFEPNDEPFNFCKLLCGSEGTLAFTTAIKLHLDKLPDPHPVVVAAHFNTINESMRATQIAMRHTPSACELMDKTILDCTKGHDRFEAMRWFVEGDPAAVLMVEFRGKTEADAQASAQKMINDLQSAALGFAFPIVSGQKTKAIWTLRSAGLGLLANIPGDRKAVACIEDTAVALEDLPNYIEEFAAIMARFGQEAVYYAHAGAGEIHLRPILDLKIGKDVQQFHDISEAVAKLVKKYNGSLSGEHGDGRVRAAFIPIMVGEEIYTAFQEIKSTWDPKGIFNPGKIVDAPPMNTSLRYAPDIPVAQTETLFNFDANGGLLRLAEKCNGSGDCRKAPESGGTMCPSFHATRNEKDTTRARANSLRNYITQNTLDKKENPFDQKEIKEVLDLCLSCKGCTSECPSKVDMSTMKAEFLYQYQKENGIPLRSKAFSYIHQINKWTALLPGISNFFLGNKRTGGMAKKVLDVAPERDLPKLHKSLRKWTFSQPANPIKTIYFFCDEFTEYNDAPIGKKAILLLTKLGYAIKLLNHDESGRAALSKGLLEKAQQHARANFAMFKDLISEETPLVGLEPSAILSFRDEYPKLVAPEHEKAAKSLGQNCLTIEEFLGQEIAGGRVSATNFTSQKKHIALHGHCHQKALSSVYPTTKLLSLPANYTVEIIPSGCCGMAGSFGYEKEHYQVSMQIGETTLFPAVRKAEKDTIIAAPGTSCRHQIWDGTTRKAFHPVEILFDALAETE